MKMFDSKELVENLFKIEGQIYIHNMQSPKINEQVSLLSNIVSLIPAKI